MAAARRDEQIGGMITKFKATKLGEPSGTASPSTATIMGGRSSLKTSERRPVSTVLLQGLCRCEVCPRFPELRPDAFRGRCLAS
jgi:hypothetical protein